MGQGKYGCFPAIRSTATRPRYASSVGELDRALYHDPGCLKRKLPPSSLAKKIVTRLTDELSAVIPRITLVILGITLVLCLQQEPASWEFGDELLSRSLSCWWLLPSLACLLGCWCLPCRRFARRLPV